jgi:hypothetical protein
MCVHDLQLEGGGGVHPRNSGNTKWGSGLLDVWMGCVMRSLRGISLRLMDRSQTPATGVFVVTGICTCNACTDSVWVGAGGWRQRGQGGGSRGLFQA